MTHLRVRRFARQSNLVALAVMVLFFSGLSSSFPAASKAGEPATGVQRAVLHVEGMTCASCAVAIRTALTRLSGVESAEVKVAEKQAIVLYHPAQVRPPQLVEAVNKLGYVARLATPEEP